jgi:putative ABC transporter-associated repeat protein
MKPALLALALLLLAAAPAQATVTLADGHVDVGSARMIDGHLRFLVKDGTRGTVVWRDPASVVTRVVDRARVTLPAGMSAIGAKGQVVWMIPQVQQPGVIWAGWNTEEITTRQIRGGVTWQLDQVSGPGRVVVFQTGSFGDEHILFNSAQKLPQRVVIPPGTHAHGNWAFTKPGTYRLRCTMRVTTSRGQRQSAGGTLTFRVG